MRWPGALLVAARQSRSCGRLGARSHVAALLLAACLGGCGGYSSFDGEYLSSILLRGAAAAPSPRSASSDRRESATLDTLFAGAAEGSDDRNATRPAAVASATDAAPEPARPSNSDIAAPRGRAYLFRGVAGLIYSRGMDSLADRI